MQTIKLDISDDIYEKVMFFLQNIPKKDIKFYPKEFVKKEPLDDKLTDFFQNSPLHNISLEREDEIYESRINF